MNFMKANLYLCLNLINTVLSYNFLPNDVHYTYTSTDDFISNPYIPRTRTYTVQIYGSTFSEAPKILVAFQSINFPHYQNAGVQLFVTDITTTTFQLTIYAPIGAVVSKVDVLYLATTDSRIAIFPFFLFGDDARKLSKGSGKRIISKDLKVPSTFVGMPEIIAFLSGFQFIGNGDAIISVDAKMTGDKRAKIEFVTNGNSKLNFVSGVALLYDKNTFNSGSLYQNFVKGNGFTSLTYPYTSSFPPIFYGMNKMDLKYGYNYDMSVILNIQLTRTELTLSPSFTPQGTTQARLFGINLFF